MSRERLIYICLSIGLLIMSIILIRVQPMSDIAYSILMCTNFVWILYMAWKTEHLSPFFFFLGTFIFLFIGGRFWGVLLTPGEFELKQGNFFNWDDVPMAIWRDTLIYILLFLYLATIAYISRIKNHSNAPILCNEGTAITKLDIVLFVVYCLLAPFVLYDIVQRFLIAFSGDGYLSLYLDQTENVTPGSGLVSTMLYVFLGIALVYGNKHTKRLYLILVFIKAFVFILIGQRAKFGSMMLFFIWYYFRNRKVNLVKIAIMGVCGIFLLMLIASLSIRSVVNDDSISPLSLLSQFLYTRGVSLTTFTNSQEIESYPIVPYFVSFIPGFASLWSFFSELNGVQASFANYLAYALSPALFESGHGLGWTVLSDLYLYSGRTFTGFSLLSLLFGYICATIENKSRNSDLAAIIVFSVFLNFTFLPRAGLYTIVPLIMWICLVYFILIYLLGFHKQIVMRNEFTAETDGKEIQQIESNK